MQHQKTCLNCNNEAKGRSKYCSDKCKVAYNRNRIGDETVTNETVTENRNSPPCTAKQMTSPCHACVEQCDYLKCQTTAVPGDADYVGVVKEVDGVYKVAQEK